MLEPIVDDASDRRDTVTALLSQLHHRIALRNPPLKPHALAETLVEGILPTKRATTLTAKPTLCPMPAFSVAPYACRATPWTVLFLSLRSAPLLNAVNYGSANRAERHNFIMNPSIPFEHYSHCERSEAISLGLLRRGAPRNDKP